MLVVDTGAAGTSDKVLAAIKALAPDKEIRWMVNTTFRPDHTGGNEPMAKAGRTVNGNIAAIVAHENVAARMIKAGVPDRRVRTIPISKRRATSRSTASRSLIYHPASANTDTESMVMFRRSDVIATGDIFRTDSLPGRSTSTNGGTDAGDDRRAQPHPRR